MAKRDSQVCFSSTSSAMKFLYLFLKVDFISNPRDNSANLFNCLIIAESTCYDYIYLLILTTLRSVAILDAPCDITRQLTLFNKKHTCFVIVTFEFLATYLDYSYCKIKSLSYILSTPPKVLSFTFSITH